MKKSLVLLMSLILIATSIVLPITTVNQASAATTLEAPLNVVITSSHEDYLNVSFRLSSNMMKFYNHEVVPAQMDIKVDDGEWQYTADWDLSLNENLPDPWYAYDASGSYEEVTGVVEFAWMTTDTHGEAVDLENHTYSARIRFATPIEDTTYAFSPWSAVGSIGKGVTAYQTRSLSAPQDLAIGVLEDASGEPYFKLTWTNPESIITEYAKLQKGVQTVVEQKIDEGAWVEVGYTFHEFDIFHPEDMGIDGIIDIEAHTYQYRLRYQTDADFNNNLVVKSPYSNTVRAGVPSFYANASPWAEGELDQAADLGLITDRIKDDVSGPITREEFAEVAVLFYSMVTGTKTEPAPVSTFTDTTNPEILKAFALGITSGVGNNKFDPKKILNREQMAKMIVGTLKACYPDMSPAVTGVPSFTDQVQISSWAVDPTKFMYKFNITTGTGGGNFSPKTDCTREQALAFLIRAFNKKDLY